jgi:hypothetical protein
MSASKIPTLNPWFLSVAAILIATVLLPTPPLQLLTAMIFLIWERFFFLVNFYSSAFGARLMSTSVNPLSSRFFLIKLLSLR